MAHQPNNRADQSNHQNNENDPAFAALLSQSAMSPRTHGVVTIALVLQGNRDVEAAAAFVRSREQFLALLPRHFFGQSWRFFNHPLKLFHLLAQLRFAADKVLLGLIKCAGGFGWAPKHAGYGPFELSQKIIRNAMNPKIING